MVSTKRVKQAKPFLFILLILPSFLWIYMFFAGTLGINPIEKFMDKLGEMALRLIILTLFISSISDVKFLRSLTLLRRMIGVFAFIMCACIYQHTLCLIIFLTLILLSKISLNDHLSPLVLLVLFF